MSIVRSRIYVYELNQDVIFHITIKYKFEVRRKISPIRKKRIKSILPHFFREIIMRIMIKWTSKKIIITNMKAMSAPPS